MSFDSWHQRMMGLCAAIALFGGLVLSGIALLVVYAVIAAKFGFPLLGDTEIVEFAAAVAVFSFMPYCQMKQGQVAVTVFTSRFPVRFQRFLDVVGHGVMTAVIVILCWRLYAGGLDAFSRSHVSMFLQIPAWWAYVLIAFPCFLWALAAGIVTVQIAIRPEYDDHASDGTQEAV